MAESVNRWNVNGVYYEIHDYGRGLPGGVATLDPNGRIPYQQLPESTIEYKGTWNASTNDPHLADGTGNKGDMYFCVTSGTVTLGTGRTIAFYIGDRVIYDGTIWERLPAGGVYSVNNKDGDVVLYGTDIQRTANSAKTVAESLTDIENTINELDVSDPSSSGTSSTFIKSISQTDGKITPLKASLPSASESTEGITKKVDTYSGNGTDAVTGKAVKAAIDGLDVTDTEVAGQYVSKVSETDGKIAVTRKALPSTTDTEVAGQYVSKVSETDGKIAVTRKALPSTTDAEVAGQYVSKVSETDGKIAVTRKALPITKAEIDGTTLTLTLG